MKYFLDTEFLEGTQKTKPDIPTITVGISYILISLISFIFYNGIGMPIFMAICGIAVLVLSKWKIKVDSTKPTIDLISIGIVAEEGREYYAISKDFNLKEAWNRYDIKKVNDGRNEIKVFWIRDNVLKPILKGLLVKSLIEEENSISKQGKSAFYTSIWQNTEYKDCKEFVDALFLETKNTDNIWFSKLKRLIKKYGKSNKEIAGEIKTFIGTKETVVNYEEVKHILNPEFYTYYGAYDWIVFCWLFGKMINLPEGFPMFSRDLKVMLDDKAFALLDAKWVDSMDNNKEYDLHDLKSKVSYLKSKHTYPTQDNLHNALDDAKWNKRLYEFINTL